MATAFPANFALRGVDSLGEVSPKTPSVAKGSDSQKMFGFTNQRVTFAGGISLETAFPAKNILYLPFDATQE